MDTIEIIDWFKQDKLMFKDQHFEKIDINNITSQPYFVGPEIKTELVFENCTIKSFNSSVLLIEKPIVFRNCKIGVLCCYGTYFFGGFEMKKCTIHKATTFGCGVHNLASNKFIIDRCDFHGFVDFFDVYFGGPVQLTNNEFHQGTNFKLYFPYGIEKESLCLIENNVGDLEKEAESN